MFRSIPSKHVITVTEAVEAIVQAYYYLAEKLGMGAGYAFVETPSGPYSAELSRDLRVGRLKPLKALAHVELISLTEMVLEELHSLGARCERSILVLLAKLCSTSKLCETLRSGVTREFVRLLAKHLKPMCEDS